MMLSPSVYTAVLVGLCNILPANGDPLQRRAQAPYAQCQYGMRFNKYVLSLTGYRWRHRMDRGDNLRIWLDMCIFE